MVLILLTLVFLLMRVAPGDPITAALGGHVPPAVARPDQGTQLGYDKPISSSTASTSWQIAHGQLRDDDHRPPADERDHRRERRRDARADLLRDDHRDRRRRARSASSPAGIRDTPIDVGGRLFGIIIYATPVFFLGLLAQLSSARGSTGSRPRTGRARSSQATLETHTNLYVDRRDHRPQLERVRGRRQAPDPAGGHARARTAGVFIRLGPRQRDPDDEGRLHRGGARARASTSARSSITTRSGTRSCR